MTAPTRWLARVVTEHSGLVVAVLLLATAAFAVGMTEVEESSSLEGIAADSETADAYETARTDFSASGPNTTTMVVAVRAEDGNALSKASLVRTLRYQRALRNNGTLNATLVDDRPTAGVANVVATVAMGDELEARAERLATALEAIYARQIALERWRVAAVRGTVDEATAEHRRAEIRESIAERRAAATADLDESQAEQFNDAADRLQRVTTERSELEAGYRRGEVGEDEYRNRASALDERTEWAFRNGTAGVFEDRVEALEDADRGPPLDAQIEQLESMDDEAVAAVVERVVDPGRSDEVSRAAYRLLPREYDPGSTAASARLVVVTQETDGPVRAAPAISSDVSDGQLAARSLAESRAGPEQYHVVSRGLVGVQQDRAIGDSMAILGPLALVFVLLSLSVAYRDPVDVILGLVGVGVVLVWTLGAMGWLGIPFGQTMIAAPILLVGLSVDYAFHVALRYREERTGDGVRPAMRRALVGVGPALALVTATTGVGFLANLTSPLGGVRNFALVTAVGIGATLAVFGLLVPALKTAVDRYRVRREAGDPPALPGSTGGVDRLLRGGATLARRAPVAVLVVALLLSAGGAYGATDVEVATSQELFMADDPPEWVETLPEPVEPGEYFLKENRRYLQSTFQSPAQEGYVLVEGNVTAPGTLDRVAAAERVANRSDAVQETPRGEPAVEGPLSAMREAAEGNETFNATFAAADVDGDGVPDRNLSAVYDGFHGAAPDRAARTVHRTDEGKYTAMRISLVLDGDADQDAVFGTATGAAAAFDGRSDLRATPTGTPLLEAEDSNRVATSMIEGLAVTGVVVFGLLVVAFRVREGSAALGVLTLAPVAFAVSWLFATFALLEFAISPVTALVGSVAVGLGVDYAIHVSERFTQEHTAGVGVETAVRRTVTGTGSALVSSAGTTAAGFGVLSFALLPGLRQFGLLLAVGVVYALVATVYVQPSLLVLWSRYGTGVAGEPEPGALPGDD